MRGAVKGSFDWRCCEFLKIDYAVLEAETRKGGSDEEVLTRAFAHGHQPNPQETLLARLNGCMTVGDTTLGALEGIALDELRIEAEGHTYLRGFLGIEATAKAGYDSCQLHRSSPRQRPTGTVCKRPSHRDGHLAELLQPAQSHPP